MSRTGIQAHEGMDKWNNRVIEKGPCPVCSSHCCGGGEILPVLQLGTKQQLAEIIIVRILTVMP